MWNNYLKNVNQAFEKNARVENVKCVLKNIDHELKTNDFFIMYIKIVNQAVEKNVEKIFLNVKCVWKNVDHVFK